MTLFALEDLTVEIATPDGLIRPVDGVSWSVDRGQIAALVGESGSGKSVSAMASLGLLPSPPARIINGRINFKGQDLRTLDEESLRRVRGAQVAMVFQEPMTSLNPVRTIGRQLTEHMRLHLGLDRAGARERAIELLGLVGIAEPVERLAQFPHHFSGGMRQRVMIAIALACGPELIIADEPTTALDVTIQAQILELLKKLTDTTGVGLVLITHNLGIVARYADTVNVMYGGRIVEQGDAAELYRSPRHPYTIALLNSVPRLDRNKGDLLEPIPGSPPDPSISPNSGLSSDSGGRRDGCRFKPRCSRALDVCGQSVPELERDASGHGVACFNSPHGTPGVAASGTPGVAASGLSVEAVPAS
jgi:oligopeptide/dipeptide ABC transporter ATP-binding protein